MASPYTIMHSSAHGRYRMKAPNSSMCRAVIWTSAALCANLNCIRLNNFSRINPATFASTRRGIGPVKIGSEGNRIKE